MVLLRKDESKVILTHKLNLINWRYLELKSCSFRPLSGEPKIWKQCSKQIIATDTKGKKCFIISVYITDL